VGAEPLRVEPAEAATFEDAGFSDGQTRVLRLAPGAIIRAPVPFTTRGPGYAGRWAVIMDVQVTPPGFVEGAPRPPKKGPGWNSVPLLQTDPWNDDDAEMILDARRGLEVGGERGGSIDPATWHRVAMVVDETDGTVTGFVDGVMTRRVQTVIADSRWTLEPELVLFGAKDIGKGPAHPGLRLAALQVRTGPIESGHIALLGAPTAAGLPRATTPIVAWRRAPPAKLAVGERFSATFDVSPPSGEVALVLVGADAALELGRVPADGTTLLGAIPPAVKAGSYRFELRWSGGEATAAGAPVEIRAERSVIVGDELVADGGFDGADLRPWVIEGRVSAKPVAGANQNALSGDRGDFVVRQEIAIPLGFRGLGISASVRARRKEAITVFGDRGFLRLRFSDEAGAPLGELRSLSVDQSSWHRLKIEGPIPETAAHLTVELVGLERQGGRNEVAFDDVSVKARPLFIGSARLSKHPVLMPSEGPDQMSLIFETDFSDLAPRFLYEVAGRTQVADLETTTIDARHQVHRATISNLTKGLVKYRIDLAGVTSPHWEFQVDDPAAPFKMAWISDNQHGWKTFRTLIPLLNDEDVDFVFDTGDIVQRGYELREWQTEWFSPLGIDGFAQRTPIQVARGNHDANGALAHAYVPLPGNGHWYAFSRGGVRFIVLDSEANSERVPEQTRWLEAELGGEEARRAEFRVVVFHRAPYTNRWDPPSSKYDGERWVRGHWVPIFSKFGVDLVVAGHAHAYQRRDFEGARYLVIGGAGGRLDKGLSGKWPMDVDHVGHHFAVMEVEGRQLKWTAKDFEGKVIDTWTLKSRTRRVAGK
jgi:predicted phosphodiesterase